MNWTYFQLKYMHGLRNAFNTEPSENTPIPSFSFIPQPQPQQETTAVDATAMLVVEKIFAMRYEIMRAIINRNRF
jgi:hypothetical protein